MPVMIGVDLGVMDVDISALTADEARYVMVTHHSDGTIEWGDAKDLPPFGELKRLPAKHVNCRSGVRKPDMIKVRITASECNGWLRSLPPVDLA